jgi:hypothetical protein
VGPSVIPPGTGGVIRTDGGLCFQAQSEGGQPLSQKELDRLALLPEYTLDNAHYYCETADVSRPFPSARPVSQPSWEFVWNRWLTAALRQCGLPAASPHLMQVRVKDGHGMYLFPPACFSVSAGCES